MPPSHGLNGKTQVLKHGDVAADGAGVDFQALGQFGSAELLARLQQFEDGQYAGGWEVHADSPFLVHTQATSSGMRAEEQGGGKPRPYYRRPRFSWHELLASDC